MAVNLMGTARKLTRALNTRDYNLTLNAKQFIGKDGNPHHYYTICKGVYNPDRGRYDHTEIYGTASMVRIVLFLRDMWYRENDWPLPMDQPLWNTIREELGDKRFG